MRTPTAGRIAAALAALVLASIAQAAPPVAAAARPELHYRLARYTFDVADEGRSPDEPSLQRQVTWQYPVFTDTRDPATAALNAWIRTQAVQLLLAPSPLATQALHLTDRELIARAAVDRDFVDSGVDQAVWLPGAALGRYRAIEGYSEYVGGSHPVHRVKARLYDMRRREERALRDLFRLDAPDKLEDLYDAQKKQDDAHPCEFRHFDWSSAALAAPDTLGFEYPYEPGQGVECDDIVVKGRAVARLLKSPRDLAPVFQLVADKP